jgi:hypothetical protein
MALLERHYDPLEGHITLDGVDIRELNVQWLRSQCALVSQQPILFPTSIYLNIACGKENATEEEVIAAAKMVLIWCWFFKGLIAKFCFYRPTRTTLLLHSPAAIRQMWAIWVRKSAVARSSGLPLRGRSSITPSFCFWTKVVQSCFLFVFY